MKLGICSLSYLPEQALFEVANAVSHLPILLGVVLDYSGEFLHALRHLSHHAGLQLTELFLAGTGRVVAGESSLGRDEFARNELGVQLQNSRSEIF